MIENGTIDEDSGWNDGYFSRRHFSNMNKYTEYSNEMGAFE